MDSRRDVLREDLGPVGRGHLHADHAGSPTVNWGALPDHRLVKVPPVVQASTFYRVVG